MQGWDAVRAALNPFAIAQRPKVPTGRGPGRQIVFAVDTSKYSEAAVRYGLDNVARSNDSCSFACVYKKASQHTPDAGPFMDGTMVRTETDHKLRVQAERLDRRRCEDATRRYAEDAKKAGVAAVSVDVLPAGHGAGGGNVAETIAAYVASKRADLVVVGSRGIGSLRRSVLTLVGLGSVSDYLARHVDAPLLLVRTPARSTAERPKESTEAETDESFAPPEGGFARGK